MTKDELIMALEEDRESILESIEGLSDENMLLPGVVDGWSVKDVLAHLSRWEAELIKQLWQLRQGQRPTTVHFSGQSDDEINARWHSESRNRELGRVLEDFHGVRTQTIRRVEEFSEKDLNEAGRYRWLEKNSLWKVVAESTFEHEAEHEAAIRAWRELTGY
jgi:hypothetical protein